MKLDRATVCLPIKDPAVDDRVVDRLEGGEPVTDLGHVRPGLGGVVIHTRKDPDPAVGTGSGHGGVGAPPQVRPVGDDRAVMRPWLAAAPDPLGSQQPFTPEQPQHPLAADLDAVLAT